MNELDKFEQSIKDKLEQLEYPIDDKQFDLIYRKINNNFKYNFNMNVIIFTSVLLMFLPNNINNKINYIEKYNYVDSFNDVFYSDKKPLCDKNHVYISTVNKKSENDLNNKSINDNKNTLLYNTDYDILCVLYSGDGGDIIINDSEPKIDSETVNINNVVDDFNDLEKSTDLIEINDTINTVTLNIVKDLYFPDIFTPNFDGINDYFFPIGNIEEQPFQFIIFDRYGIEVFETININHKWNGENCENGIYAYIFKIQYNNGDWKSITGTVLLKK